MVNIASAFGGLTGGRRTQQDAPAPTPTQGLINPATGKLLTAEELRNLSPQQIGDISRGQEGAQATAEGALASLTGQLENVEATTLTDIIDRAQAGGTFGQTEEFAKAVEAQRGVERGGVREDFIDRINTIRRSLGMQEFRGAGAGGPDALFLPPELRGGPARDVRTERGRDLEEDIAQRFGLTTGPIPSPFTGGPTLPPGTPPPTRLQPSRPGFPTPPPTAKALTSPNRFGPAGPVTSRIAPRTARVPATGQKLTTRTFGR